MYYIINYNYILHYIILYYIILYYIILYYIILYYIILYYIILYYITLRVSGSQEASTSGTHMKTLVRVLDPHGSPLWKVWTLPTSDSLRNSMPLKWHAMATPDNPDCGWAVLHDLREPGFALRDLRKPWS